MILREIARTPSVDTDLAPLSRKFKRLEDDLSLFCRDDLSLHAKRRGVGRQPIPGVPGVWKTRMGIPSANIGARGGLRIVYWPTDVPPLVTLLRAWHKAEIKDLPRKALIAAKVRARPLIEARAAKLGYPPEMIAKLFDSK